MKTASMPQYNKWVDFQDISKKAPEAPGVYIFRLKGGKIFQRINGETDIIYIGSSNNLKRRMGGYLHPGKSQFTNQKVSRFVNQYQHDVEVAWFEYPNADNAKAYEGSLIKQYEMDHHEFPPLNGATIRKMKFNLNDRVGIR